MAFSVLIVDDEPELRMVMVDALSAEALQLIETGTGTEALAAYDGAAGAIDLVVVDMQLPDMSGTEVIAKLSAANPNLRFLMCTGRGRASVPNSPNVAYLPKPFLSEEFLESVQKQIRLVRQSRTSAGQ